MDNLKISRMTIEGIGGITNLDLSFKEGLNLICGANGIGKTTILDCISHAFIRNSTQKLKRNVKCEKGKCFIEYEENHSKNSISYELTHFNATGEQDFLNKLSNKSENILVFNTQRSFTYMNLNNIAKDPVKETTTTASEAYSGVSASDIKNWFVQRFLWSAHKDALKPEQLYNFELGKIMFSQLDSDVAFSRVIPDTYDIMVNTKHGEVYFEYLSSGFKSCVYILLGIIKEIEFRFKEPYIKAEDFTGIVLIDEIDVHLHPQWQGSLLLTLKKLIPKAQIIATTHSPSMIQCAEADEIIPLQFDADNRLIIKDISISEYGFQGWSIEEILTDVMGLKTTRSELFSNTIYEFDKAIDSNKLEIAKEKYIILDKMLHPTNHLRKIFEIEMIGADLDD